MIPSRLACLAALTAAASIVSMWAATAPAAAQGTEAERRACTPDVMRLCREFIPSVERITACLIARGEELNPDCKLVMFPPEETVATAAPAKPAKKTATKSTKTSRATKAAKPAAARKSTAPLNILPAAAPPAKKKKAAPRPQQAQRAP